MSKKELRDRLHAKNTELIKLIEKLADLNDKYKELQKKLLFELKNGYLHLSKYKLVWEKQLL